MNRIRYGAAALALMSLCVACGRNAPPTSERQFSLTGQVLSIKTDRSEVRVKHDEVKGFMPAMTMSFGVKDRAVLASLVPGDLITATLVVTDDEAYLTAIRKTGTAPIAGAATSPTTVADPLMAGEAVPDIIFSDDHGDPRPLAGYRGNAVLLTFFYARCPLPDYCPRMHKYFAAVQAAIKARPALRARARLLSVSFDPDFDTPAALKTLATSVGADPAIWRFVTAPRAEVEAFGATLGLSVVRDGARGENITHNLRTALVNRDGTLVKTYNGNDWSPGDVVRDLEALVK